MTPLYLFELKLGSKQPSCSSYSVIAVMGVVHSLIPIQEQLSEKGQLLPTSSDTFNKIAVLFSANKVAKTGETVYIHEYQNYMQYM